VLVAVPAQVTLVLLHDAMGRQLRSLALRISARKASGGETLCGLPCVTASSSQLCSNKVGFEKDA